jgi:hypothetical protein
MPGSSGSISYLNSGRQGRSILLCALLLSALALTSCGPLSDYVSHPPAAASAPPPPDNGGVPALYEPNAAAPPPPGGAAPTPPGPSGAPLMPNGLPAIPPKGVDLQKQFSEDIKDPIERIKRVENAVVDLRRDFDAVYPSIQRLVAVEQDMQDLTRQLGTLLQNEPQSSAAVPGGAGGPERLSTPPGSSPVLTPVPAPAPVTAVTAAPVVPPPAATAPVAPVAPAPAPIPAPAVKPRPLGLMPLNPAAAAPETAKPVKAAQTGLNVKDLRIGEHPGSTRMVLDVGGAAAFTADVDNDEHLLVVQLPGAGWSGAAQGAVPKSPLITSWSAQPLENGKGTRLVIQLKKNAKIVYQKALPAKIVIDLAGG